MVTRPETFETVRVRTKRGSARESVLAYSSIQQAVAAHKVSESTLRDRLAGHTPKKDTQWSMQSLISTAEAAMIELIQRCAISGYPLTPAQIRSYIPLPCSGLLAGAELPSRCDQRPTPFGMLWSASRW